MNFLKSYKLNSKKLAVIWGLALVFFNWAALALTFLNFFHTSLLAIFAILYLAIASYLTFLSRDSLIIKKEFFWIGGLSLLAIMAFSFFSTPTVFTGRDQGALSNAAIMLSQNHAPKVFFPAEKEFFKIYGPGEALNFPGFNYDTQGNLVPHFPLGYISYLAAFFSFFGLSGFILANALAFFIFSLSFYSTARNFLHEKESTIALILVLTSFAFSWISKFTLSENLALGLIWFGLWTFINYLKTKDTFYLFSFFATYGILLFTRIETMALILISIAILFFFHKTKYDVLKALFKKSILLALGLIIIFFIWSFFANQAFYPTFAKGFLNSFAPSEKPAAEAIHFWQPIFYVIKIFSIYTILTYLLLALVALVYFLKRKDFKILIPFFLLAPFFIYVLNPSITLDHPWMLRRFVFAVIPLSILYTVFFLRSFFRRNIFFYTFSFFLLLTNLIIFIPYLSVKENMGLLEKTKSLSSNFSENDLILVDRFATGDPWLMLAGPLNVIFQKQAVYFFNPNDFDKLDLKKFDRVYFIIPDNNLEFYKNSSFFPRLEPSQTYVLENSALNIFSAKKSILLSTPIELPQYQKNYVYGKIYLLKD